LFIKIWDIPWVEELPNLSQIIFGGNPFKTEISIKSESNVTIQKLLFLS
jgi:hypothetical protein